MTMLTWPGPRKPSICRSGSSRMARSVGMMVMWLQNTEKLATPSRRACSNVIAVAGIVVSKPRPKNTTGRCGLSRASCSASSGEYTMRTSAPSARACSRLCVEPGTRIASPKVAKIMPGCRASAIASSTRPIGNTQTGQPGPCTNSTVGGNICWMP